MTRTQYRTGLVSIVATFLVFGGAVSLVSGSVGGMFAGVLLMLPFLFIFRVSVWLSDRRLKAQQRAWFQAQQAEYYARANAAYSWPR